MNYLISIFLDQWLKNQIVDLKEASSDGLQTCWYAAHHSGLTEISHTTPSPPQNKKFYLGTLCYQEFNFYLGTLCYQECEE